WSAIVGGPVRHRRGIGAVNGGTITGYKGEVNLPARAIACLADPQIRLFATKPNDTFELHHYLVAERTKSRLIKGHQDIELSAAQANMINHRISPERGKGRNTVRPSAARARY